MNSGNKNCGNGLAGLVEPLSKGEGFYCISAKAGRKNVVEKISQSGIGVVCFERNAWTLYRKAFPAVCLDNHDEGCCNAHGDDPGEHPDIPVLAHFDERDLVENKG